MPLDAEARGEAAGHNTTLFRECLQEINNLLMAMVLLVQARQM